VEIEPIPDRPAILADDVLVVADLHIGLEEELFEKGVVIPSRAEVMGRRLVEIADRPGAERLVILGDVKHLVPKMASRERRDVYVFFRELAEHFREIYVAQGNHDGILKSIVPRTVRFRSPYGFRLDDVGFCHGHAWPYKKVMEAKVLLMGHNHPAVAFTDELGSRQIQPCWMRAPFLRRHKRYPKLPQEAIVVPAFNELCGGMPVNDVHTRFLGPLFREKLLSVNEASIHLLDGTNLGRLGDLKVDSGWWPEDYRQ
jgi:putative SbcD/Mre11-related phosphoesterase